MSAYVARAQIEAKGMRAKLQRISAGEEPLSPTQEQVSPGVVLVERINAEKSLTE